MAMFPGAQRENVDYGGKGCFLSRAWLIIVILPPTALDKLSSDTRVEVLIHSSSVKYIIPNVV
jgi:hypothetical protein